MPLTIIAIPASDFAFAVVRRTWRGQSPFAADRGHLHHRLLEIGHSHSRAVLIMYFWAALIGFGALAYSVNSASMWIVLGIVGLSFIGLMLLLLPRFTPRAPRWAERFVPPRYRRRRRAALVHEDAAPEPAAFVAGEAFEIEGTGEEATEAAETSAPVGALVAGVAGSNGATATGARSRLLDRRRTGTSR
jgi:UDP-GlcNAc:undecaprenyl-phosphate GlcNAc-1-phosphate transferase